MNIRIGIQQSMKDIELEMGDDVTAQKLQEMVGEAIAATSVLWLSDKRGRTVGVPAARISFVEIDRPSERVVGFGA